MNSLATTCQSSLQTYCITWGTHTATLSSHSNTSKSSSSCIYQCNMSECLPTNSSLNWQHNIEATTITTRFSATSVLNVSYYFCDSSQVKENKKNHWSHLWIACLQPWINSCDSMVFQPYFCYNFNSADAAL